MFGSMYLNTSCYITHNTKGEHIVKLVSSKAQQNYSHILHREQNYNINCITFSMT